MKLDMIQKRNVEDDDEDNDKTQGPKKAFQYLSYDINDRKIMTVDSTKFADLLYLLKDPLNNNTTATDNDDDNETSGSTHEINNNPQTAIEILTYRKQLENMIQTESKLHYELQKLQHIVSKQKSSKKKTVHANIHQKIEDIQIKIDEIVKSSNMYFEALSLNITNNIGNNNTNTNNNTNNTNTNTNNTNIGNNNTNNNNINSNSATDVTYMSTNVHPQNNNNNNNNAPKNIYDMNKIEYDATKDFIDRGSQLILNYFNRNSIDGKVSGNMKNKNNLSKMEETWERVILAERMRRMLLLETNMIPIGSKIKNSGTKETPQTSVATIKETPQNSESAEIVENKESSPTTQIINLRNEETNSNNNSSDDSILLTNIEVVKNYVRRINKKAYV